LKIVSVIVARDEEEMLFKTVDSIKPQVDHMIVVDDGSVNPIHLSDCTVIHLPRHEFSLVGHPELSLRLCIGLQEARKLRPDYIFITGADHIIEAGYVEEVAKRMARDGSVLGAGALHENLWFHLTLHFSRRIHLTYKVPPGSGRIIDARWWETVNGCKYPYGWGWESWLIHEALRLGKKVTIYPDIQMRGNKPASNWAFRKGFNWGRGCYALGLLPLSVLARFRDYWFAPTFMFGLVGGYALHPNTERYPHMWEYKKVTEIDRYRRRLRHFFHELH
jgi:hypothetical protein